MADVTKEKNVDVDVDVEADPAEPAVDVKRLKKDYDKTTRELEKLRAARKQEEDAKLSETDKLRNELESYKTRASKVDEHEQFSLSVRDELLDDLADDVRSELEESLEGLDTLQQIKQIKAFKRLAGASEQRAHEQLNEKLANDKPKVAFVDRSRPVKDRAPRTFTEWKTMAPDDRKKYWELATRLPD